MDVHVPAAITAALRLRGVNVLTAREDRSETLSDPALLDQAALRGRILFSRDADLLREATARQRSGISFAGLIYAHQLDATIGQCVEDLELIAKACTPVVSPESTVPSEACTGGA